MFTVDYISLLFLSDLLLLCLLQYIVVFSEICSLLRDENDFSNVNLTAKKFFLSDQRHVKLTAHV